MPVIFVLTLCDTVLGSKPCPYDSDFRCGDGVCIRSNQVCNRFNNCKDGSDEVNCSKYAL